MDRPSLAQPHLPHTPQWAGTRRAATWALLALAFGGCAGRGPDHDRGPVVTAPLRPARIRYAALTPDQAHDIAIHALGLVGTPYRYGGNTPAGGFDCSGLIGYVYRSRAGVAPPRTTGDLGVFGEPVELSDARAGDLVVFGTGSAPTHAGIYLGDGRFVHAPSTGGTVRLDRLTSGYWAHQAPAFRRI